MTAKEGLVFAVDPGYERSAWVLWDGTAILSRGRVSNAALLGKVATHWDEPVHRHFYGNITLVVEQVESFGMAVGREVFETVWWAGRFHQAWTLRGFRAERLTRKAVKLHLCGTPRAKDTNIRAALMDKFGGKAAAVGSRLTPGPLFGVKADEWAALAVAITWREGVWGTSAAAAATSGTTAAAGR